MSEFASILLWASLAAHPTAQQAPSTRQAVEPKSQSVQLPMGQFCVTPRGNCVIPPRPLNTRCFCGAAAGVVH